MNFRCAVLPCLFLTLYSSLDLAQETASQPSAKRTPQYTEQGSEGCLVCHSGENMRAIATSPHANPDHSSTPLARQGCEACHGPGSFHVSRAHGGQGFPRIVTFGSGPDASPKEKQVTACLSCHTEDLGSTEAIEFRDSVHDRVHEKQMINCSSCHLVHTESDPISEKEHQAATCYQCHDTTEAQHPRFEDKSIDFDALSCWTCHDVHKANAEEN